MERIDAELSAWLPAGHEGLVGLDGGVLQPPAGWETLLYCIEDVELCGPPREKELFRGEDLNFTHDAPILGALLVTDARFIFARGFSAGETGPSGHVAQLAVRACGAPSLEGARPSLRRSMNELARSATRKKVHRRGSDFCGTAAAAASEQVLPAGSLSATISGEATTDAAPGAFFSVSGGAHVEYHVSVRAHATSWVVSRRYSEFLALRDRVCKLVGAEELKDVPFPRKQVLSSDISDRREGLEIWLAAAVQTDACLKCGAFLEFLDERGADHFVELAKDVRDAQQSDASPRASHPHVEGDRAYVTLRGGDCGALRLGLDKALGPAFARAAAALAGETPRLFPGVSRRRKVMDDEYARLGVFDDARWRVVDNATYEVAPTYPPQFAVPAELDDEALEGEIKRRSKHRTPALTWRHPVSKTRCAGPRSPTRSTTRPLRPRRPPGAAGAAAAAAPAALGAASGGHKDRHALAVLGAIRRCGLVGASLAVSLAKLRRACEKNDGDFLEEVHGSRDGWDRTSQLSSLAQLLLDPYYRIGRRFRPSRPGRGAIGDHPPPEEAAP
ncbi:phosphatidylinositol-3,5-bisphosphate 3-phosphatase [Aureococcus anophagefferens]|uniref:Phosphatidylinositol-3,5-bisphosphate 3-phosphatase n=1 Tax=Aureococcus anophagefferens TaxID=44056 RepID=A0ABR1FYH5_AURAN